MYLANQIRVGELEDAHIDVRSALHVHRCGHHLGESSSCSPTCQQAGCVQAPSSIQFPGRAFMLITTRSTSCMTHK